MSSADRLDVLRERNKDLLDQLLRQREKIEVGSRKRHREDGAETQQSIESEEVLTITDADRGPARAALSRPTVTFIDSDHSVAHTSSMRSEHRGDIPSTSMSPNTKSCQKSPHRLQSGETHYTDHHFRPLLGYDWIAGVIDAEDSLIERSDDFFKDLGTFRSLNKDECVSSLHKGFSDESTLPLASENSTETNKDNHQCTFSYRINSRLFPVPLSSQECCPVCKRHKSTHPHTAAEPALIRVSIPCSTLLPPHKHKAHRRCSFDPSDSLGLPSHCLSGWSNKGQNALTAQSSLDLRSSLDTKKGTENKELEDLTLKLSKNQKPQQIPHVSLLPRHNFSPRKKK